VKDIKSRDSKILEGSTMLTMTVEATLVPYFQSLFQAGFIFQCEIGYSIDDLLFRQLALDREYADKHVSTVFLDGRCVDDISSAILKEGSIVAFSSALPGLAGATLRRGGAYACLRDSITYTVKDESVRPREGTITIKLFNLLMGELGHVFLRKGIIVKRSTAIALLQKQHADFWKKVRTVRLGSKTLDLSVLTKDDTFDNYGYVHISIAVENTP